MDTSTRLAEALVRCSKAYQGWTKKHLIPGGTTPARARVLDLLRREGPQTMHQVSRSLHVTPRNVTKLVDHLETSDLVRRTPHPTDRRATGLQLTSQGRHLAEIFQQQSPRLEEAFAVLDPKQQEQLAEMLETLTRHLQGRAPS